MTQIDPPDPRQDPTVDLLASGSMPQAAALLRGRIDSIVRRWNEAVKEHLPDADPLTAKQVRTSIPAVLEKIALALESSDPGATNVLLEVGTAHGVARFQQNYDVTELLSEYRLLRRIVFEELHAAEGRPLGPDEVMAVNMGIDAAMQRGVTSFIEHQNRLLKSGTDAESKYLSFLSHDLRNNLNGVMLTLEVLARRLKGLPEYAEDVQDIQTLQRSVSETIEGMNRLLQAERLRKNAVATNLAPVDLHALADDILTRPAVARRAAEKVLTMENAVPAGAGAHSDRELLTLLLQNVVGNAVKYSTAGAVRVAARDEGRGWILSVSDQGPGIAPEHLDQLFQAFSRGETHGQSGMGLGLTIASHAARLLGSELKVESKLGSGSTFSVLLPPANENDAK